MTNVGDATKSQEAQSRNIMNICTKYESDILIFCGSYDGHRQHTTYDGRRTTPVVWHELTCIILPKFKSIQPCKSTF